MITAPLFERCYECDDLPRSDPDPDPYCEQHDDALAALAYPVRTDQAARLAMTSICSAGEMTPDELLQALSLRDHDELHLYLEPPVLDSYGGDLINLSDAMAQLAAFAELAVASVGADENGEERCDARLVAPDHVVLSFHSAKVVASSPDEVRGTVPARRTAEESAHVLSFLRNPEPFTHTNAQYATGGEWTRMAVLGREDFFPQGPQNDLYEAVLSFQHEHSTIIRSRLDLALPDQAD
ncbi:hypothetical protein TR51_10695 [Kitasatospora griseola]|uniref:Uncharacterized protein n=2 Tax=Kitasatospora griseola TaxID=2064 RepID=A0A0D0PWG4_KITGR|nr:hypothetical protein TR51_10695 [Kitasatospora griseola]